jgi:hypothetical protein
VVEVEIRAESEGEVTSVKMEGGSMEVNHVT